MAINRNKIIEDLSQIKVVGNKDGLIESFNVYVNQLPTTFWNGFAERLTMKAPPDLLPSVEYLLVNAGQECGYFTGNGIMTSEEWNAIVAPMVETPEDALAGAFAVLTAFGWAKSEIVELEPGKRMVVRAYDYYESDVVTIGVSSKKSAYMLRGICSAFMSLAYNGFSKDGSKIHDYKCTQVKGIECGDNYGEFIVEKA